MTVQLPMAEIAWRYEQGESSPELAREFRTTATTIVRKLRAVGVTIRPKTREVIMTPEKLDQLRTMMIDGEKQEYIAAVLGVSLGTITRYARELRKEARGAARPSILGGLAVKRCSSCWTTRPLAEFSDDCTKRDGIRSNCKHCERRTT